MQYDFNKVAGKIINRQELDDAIRQHKQARYSGFTGKLRKAWEIIIRPYTLIVDVVNGVKALVQGVESGDPSVYVSKDKVDEYNDSRLGGARSEAARAFPKEHIYADATQVLKFMEKAVPRDFNTAARIVENLADYRAKAVAGEIVPPRP